MAVRLIEIRGTLTNAYGSAISSDSGYAIGCQWFDPASGRFLREGLWVPLPEAVAARGEIRVDYSALAPAEDGLYHVIVSVVHPEQGWMYSKGAPFLLSEVEVRNGQMTISEPKLVTWRELQRGRKWQRLAGILTTPFRSIFGHRRLLATLVRREIQMRYRGSVGEMLWAILNPLLLMGTYVFVFGFVLKARFPGDTSSTGYLLSFLAGLVPWLGINEAVARSPWVLVENRNIVKKLVFPLELLPLTPLFAGLVNQTVAFTLLMIGFVSSKGIPPGTLLWLPALILLQIMLVAGINWMLAATGVFLRDLGQAIGFLLTLVFFLTPICYPESALPAGFSDILSKNPVYFLVTSYRQILLQGQAPDLIPFVAHLSFAATCLWLGYAWFERLRPEFVDAL